MWGWQCEGNCGGGEVGWREDGVGVAGRGSRREVRRVRGRGVLVGSDEMWGWKERAERRGRWEVTTEKRKMKATVEHGWRLPLISATDKSATAAGVGAATEATAATAGATAAAAKGT